MQYEVLKSAQRQDEWRVEAINYEGDGEVYVTIFAGPSAQQRADEYAAWKNAAKADRRREQRSVAADRRRAAV